MRLRLRGARRFVALGLGRFYVGATVLHRDEVEAKAQSADVVAGKCPALAFSKDEKEGTFFEVGDTILSVYAKTEYFSRDKCPQWPL